MSASSGRRSGRLLAPVAVAAALTIAACGGSSGSSDATIPADADVVVLAVDGIRWDQSEYTASAGEVTIAAQNVSSLPHDLHVVTPGGRQLPASIDLPNRGEVRTETFSLEPGSYTLICTIPGHANMTARLAVS